MRSCAAHYYDMEYIFFHEEITDRLSEELFVYSGPAIHESWIERCFEKKLSVQDSIKLILRADKRYGKQRRTK